ncbi:MAG: hypothetical protein PUB99_03280, partial [Oscillospiraceae bacterium]|nr:hypothetical protein [Oscillospiraceae bacterium]
MVWLARLFSFDIRVYAKDTKLLFRKNAGGEGAFGENERTGAGIQTAPVFFWFITDFCGIKSFAQAFLKACGFQRRRLWSPTAVGEILTKEKRRRGAKTVRWTVLAWGTLAGGSPVRSTNPTIFCEVRFFCIFL